MPLELRPNCELCNKSLPPQSNEAYICSYECTFCYSCAHDKLHNVCPTCGGNFAARPIRPQQSYREEYKLGLKYHPASTKEVHCKFDEENIAAHVNRIKDIPPEKR